MSKLDEILGQHYNKGWLKGSEYKDEETTPYDSWYEKEAELKHKQQLKDLMLELIPNDNYAPTGNQIAVEAVNKERQRLRAKVNEL